MLPVNIFEEMSMLNQDSESDIETTTIISGKSNFIIARLKPQKVLPAHIHKEGSEIYHVLKGEGIMDVGTLEDSKVRWTESHVIKSGDVIEISENMVHRLKNESIEELELVFIAPQSHLSTDRYFI